MYAFIYFVFAELSHYRRVTEFMPGSRGLSMLVISNGLTGHRSQSCFWSYPQLEMVRSYVHIFSLTVMCLLQVIVLSLFIQDGTKNGHLATLTVACILVKIWPIFKIISSQRLSIKFVVKQLLNSPPHLENVATLPCEISTTFFTHSGQRTGFCDTMYRVCIYLLYLLYLLLRLSSTIVYLKNTKKNL